LTSLWTVCFRQNRQYFFNSRRACFFLSLVVE